MKGPIAYSLPGCFIKAEIENRCVGKTDRRFELRKFDVLSLPFNLSVIKGREQSDHRMEGVTTNIRVGKESRTDWDTSLRTRHIVKASHCH